MKTFSKNCTKYVKWQTVCVLWWVDRCSACLLLCSLVYRERGWDNVCVRVAKFGFTLIFIYRTTRVRNIRQDVEYHMCDGKMLLMFVKLSYTYYSSSKSSRRANNTNCLLENWPLYKTNKLFNVRPHSMQCIEIDLFELYKRRMSVSGKSGYLFLLSLGSSN